MKGFGEHIRERRESLRRSDRRFSVRQVANRIGVEPSYLSKVERELEAPPSEPRIRALARELGENPDELLARAGKVATDVTRIICRRPRVVPPLIREIKSLPDEAVARLARRARGDKPGKEP